MTEEKCRKTDFSNKSAREALKPNNHKSKINRSEKLRGNTSDYDCLETTYPGRKVRHAVNQESGRSIDLKKKETIRLHSAKTEATKQQSSSRLQMQQPPNCEYE